MIDTEKEIVYSAAELCRLLADKKNIERSERTILSWMKNGIKRGTRMIKLESVPIGGQRCSSIEAYERFIVKLDEETE